MSFLCSIPFVASLFASCAPPAPFATGYVEGNFTLVAPVAISQIAKVPVARGDRLAAGAVLVEMERDDAEISLAQAEAQLAQAQSNLADLGEGKRPEEIGVIEANLSSAKAQAAEAERTRDRMVSLAARGAISQAQRDDAATAAETATAAVAKLEAELAVARLPARPETIAAAEAAVRGAEAARDLAQWALEQRTLTLAEPVTVFDVIRTDGEIAGPSAPVLSVLGEGAVLLRLYVPETSFSQIALGDDLQVRCDGCPDNITAKITYLADETEFTPPVIYSLENRQTLVYLIEARPDDAHALKPGQIVDVSLSPVQR
ncbi:HlyD family secretion protein [Aliiroseovarius lamellibrachiae]|uniref:HlyD family secretion protein n=1 Tax=Aliiroseovarius lamellibrachiae TaxID=1924933 RepID=UPI001BE0C5A8|nr:HlyD family efflux transporter periplasmic adaptor subunit [Aliiroseovarius lamellibrachiae]MBT2129938.1 HlyD family efflux transporter periplasmic adaptor subunit [Aliiroseovarius lamellibrachiae]